jgi:acyl-coenzyme A thioesterase PaaI-like protein
VIDNPKANIVTVNLALDFIGVAKLGDGVHIKPRVIRAGNTIGFCDALVMNGERIVARANATFNVKILEARA